MRLLLTVGLGLILAANLPVVGQAQGPPASTAAPPQAYAVDITGADLETRLMTASLQGLANRDGAQVYTISGPSDRAWLDTAASRLGLAVKWVAPPELLQAYRSKLAGQVLYDPEHPYTINIATTLAALEQAVITAHDLGLTTILDTRKRWPSRHQAYLWGLAELRPRCAERQLAVLAPEATAPRDYLVKQRIFVLESDPAQGLGEVALVRQALEASSSGTRVLGDQKLASAPLLGAVASYHDFVTPLAETANLSFHSSFAPTLPFRQRRHFLAPDPKVTYVALVYPGGESLDWCLQGMRRLWNDSGRGQVPIGWTISPALLEASPLALQYYYSEAHFTGADEMLMAPSGAGVIPAGAADAIFFGPTRRLIEQADLRTVAVTRADNLSSLAAGYRSAGARGLLALSEGGPSAPLGTNPPTVYSDLPVAFTSYRARNLRQTAADLRALGKQSGFLLVEVDPTLTPTDLASLPARLGRKFQVVLPGELLELARLSALMAAAGAGEKPQLQITAPEVSPSPPAPDRSAQVTVRASSPAGVKDVWITYRAPGAPVAWGQPMSQPTEGSYQAELPPYPEGGPLEVRAVAFDRQMMSAASEPVTVQVPFTDSDHDGLSDVFERYLGTDPARADSDGDGLYDGNDPHPLQIDTAIAEHLPLVTPPGDLPFLTQDKGSTVTQGERRAEGEAGWTYLIPLTSLPPGAPAQLRLYLTGSPVVEASADGRSWQQVPVSHEVGPPWVAAWDLPPAVMAGSKLYLRFHAQPNQPGGMGLVGLSLSSPIAAPSVVLQLSEPDYPAAGETVTARALIYHLQGIAKAELHYQVDAGPTQTLPMEQHASQIFAATIPKMSDGDRLVYWVTASTPNGAVGSSQMVAFPVGTVREDTISLLPGRDLEGDWVPAAWQGVARAAEAQEEVDSATADLSNGRYSLWLLCAPRGREIQVKLDGHLIGRLSPSAPDGWQRLGNFNAAAGKAKLEVVAGQGQPGAIPFYAQVLLTQDLGLTPPAGMIYDFVNGLRLVSPDPARKLKGRVQLMVSATGNVSQVTLMIGSSGYTQSRPPFTFSWDTTRSGNGRHTLTLIGYNRRGEPLVTLTLKVEVEN